MRVDREHDLYDDWRALRHAAGVPLRYPVGFVALLTILVGASVLFTMSQTPRYRASVTLRLEDHGTRTPMLDELMIPTGMTRASDAAEIVASTELVRGLVSPPDDGDVAHPGHPDYNRHLGLTTIVDEKLLGTVFGTLRNTFRSSATNFRLFAALDHADGADYDGFVGALDVQFLDPYRVSVTVIEADPRVETPAGAVTLAYSPGTPIAIGELRLRLVAEGEPDERVFRVRRLSTDEAVALVQSKITVQSFSDRESVVDVTVSDTSALRATEIAGALAANYLAYDEQVTRRAADRIVRHLELELISRETNLRILDRTIESIYRANPDLLDVPRAFAKLNDLRETLSLRRGEIRAVASSLDAVRIRLEAGERLQADLSKGIDDTITQKYLEYIAQLEEERLRVGAHDNGEYQEMLELKRSDASVDLHTALESLASIDAVIAALEDGDTSALGLLGTAPVQPGFVPVDLITIEYTLEFIDLERELREVSSEFNQNYAPLAALRSRVAQSFDTILQHVRSQRTTAAWIASERQAFVDDWTKLIDSRPADERMRIDAAIQTLWTRVAATVAARIGGLAREESEFTAEIDAFAARIARLPEGEALLAAPLRDRAALANVVTELKERVQWAAVAQGGLIPTASLLAPARVPSAPQFPKAAIGVAIGLLFGTIVAFAVFLTHERLAGRMHGEQAFAALSNLELLGTTPPRAALAPSAAPEFELGTQTADEYRALRARLGNLERPSGAATAWSERGPRTVGVTSCFPGEGKTDANVGLALAYGFEGRRVLFIDANLRQPTLHKRFGLVDGPGLSESLDGRKHWIQCLHRGVATHVDLLCAGEHYYAPGDLLAGPRMQGLLSDMSAAYDVVVLDLPATEDFPDVDCLGPLLDATLLLCCEEFGPSRRTFERAVERLRRTGTNVVGAVRRPRMRRRERMARIRAALSASGNYFASEPELPDERSAA